MNRKNNATYQMLTHIVDFVTRNVGLFSKNSGVANLLKALESAVAILSEQASIWVAAETATRNGFAVKQTTRENLRKYLLRVTALSRVLHKDSIELPGNASDRRLIDVGRGFLLNADSMKKDFVEHGLSAEFAEQLESAIQDFEKAIQDHRDARGQVSKARRIWTDTLKEATDALGHVDFLVANVFENDPAMLDSYAVARTVRRGGGKKTAAEASPPASDAATSAAA